MYVDRPVAVAEECVYWRKVIVKQVDWIRCGTNLEFFCLTEDFMKNWLFNQAEEKLYIDRTERECRKKETTDGTN